MNAYIGTKQVRATPEARDGRHGYAIAYPDGYLSWSPKDVFEAAYRPIEGFNLTFGDALVLLEEGNRLARAGWNGKGMFVFLVPGSRFEVNRPPLLGIYPPGTPIDYHGHIDMKTADGQIVPWTASQTDIQAKDWGLVRANDCAEDGYAEADSAVLGKPSPREIAGKIGAEMHAKAVSNEASRASTLFSGPTTRLVQIDEPSLNLMIEKLATQALLSVPGSMSRTNIEQVIDALETAKLS